LEVAAVSARSRSRSRHLVAALLATLALSLSACAVDTGPGASSGSNSAGSPSGGGAGRTLTVTAFAGAWSDTFTQAFVVPFEKRTGAKVQLVPGGGSDWLVKLRAAGGTNPPYDLMAFTPDITVQAARAGVISELDTKRIEGFSDLSPVLVQHAGADGKTYGLPLTTGSTGLAYRKDKITTPPQNWSDLTKPEYCGHVGLPPLTYNPGLEMLAGLVHEQGGSMDDPAAVDKAFATLAKLKGCTSAFPADSGSMQTAVQNGDVWIVPWWDGRAFALEQKGVPVGFVYPKSGAVGALTSYYLAKGSANQDLAYQFLSELTRPENQKVFAEGTWYAASNDKNQYSQTFKDRIKYGDQTYQSFAWIDYAKVSPQLTTLQRKWNEQFS
jgi:putative spermidine/putrescine transport system substrate-binding protein